MIDASVLAQSLIIALPTRFHDETHNLAEILAEAANGNISQEEAQRRITENSSFQSMFQVLAGKDIESGSGIISFGSNNQLGDIGFRDIAGRDIVNLSINIANPQNQGNSTVLAAVIVGIFIILAAIIGVIPLFFNTRDSRSNSNDFGTATQIATAPSLPIQSSSPTIIPATTLNDISGVWIGDFISVSGYVYDYRLSINQEGQAVSGFTRATLRSDNAQYTTLELLGSFAAGTLTFEESRVLEDTTGGNICYIRAILIYKQDNRREVLEGTWRGASGQNSCPGEGELELYRQ
jgi:hypothetical protein